MFVFLLMKVTTQTEPFAHQHLTGSVEWSSLNDVQAQHWMQQLLLDILLFQLPLK